MFIGGKVTPDTETPRRMIFVYVMVVGGKFVTVSAINLIQNLPSDQILSQKFVIYCKPPF